MSTKNDKSMSPLQSYNFSVYYDIIILLQNTLKLIHTRKLNLIIFGIQCMIRLNDKQLCLLNIQIDKYLYLSPVAESFIGWFFSLYLHSLLLTFKGTWGNVSAFELQVHLSWSFEFIYQQ